MATVSKPEVRPSTIYVDWQYGDIYERIDLNKPQRFYVNGMIGSGKSAFLEALAENYIAHGDNLIDLYGSTASECLGWLRSVWVQEHKLSALLITGDVDVSFSGQPFPVKNWRQLSLSDFEKNRIILSPRGLYNNSEEEYDAVSAIIKLFGERNEGYSRILFTLVREATYLFYSTIKMSDNTKATRTAGVDLIRQSRHHGISLGLDSQRNISVIKEIRDNLNYTIYKSLGSMAHQVDKFYFGFWQPKWLTAMKQGDFAIVSSTNNVGRGFNMMPSWHKRERENIFAALGIQVKKNNPNYGHRVSKKKRKSDDDDDNSNFKVISDP